MDVHDVPGLAAVSFGYVWWLAPETKGRPLESIGGYWENGGRWPDRAAGVEVPAQVRACGRTGVEPYGKMIVPGCEGELALADLMVAARR